MPISSLIQTGKRTVKAVGTAYKAGGFKQASRVAGKSAMGLAKAGGKAAVKTGMAVKESAGRSAGRIKEGFKAERGFGQIKTGPGARGYGKVTASTGERLKTGAKAVGGEAKRAGGATVGYVKKNPIKSAATGGAVAGTAYGMSRGRKKR